MKDVFVDVVFIDSDDNTIEKDDNLIESIYFKIIEEYTKYINAVIIK